MSEPKLISPLLDGFAIGAPMFSHDGVSCCPALKEDSEQRYIVKIISIPASQVQLDALLLTGAYKEPSAALEYFRELSDSVVKEAAALKNLARLEGFLSYEDWQVIPMENGQLGYQVYLLGTYKHTLEKYMRRNSMTHLAAVNLGIDICDALSAARRAGWIYADLKPTNIFISENKEFRIGDLGLMELDNLDLASLPGKYRSAYTAPELADDLISPNTTMDTYALGMILYQIYNNGALPQVKHPTEDIPPAPANADYELAEILLKAISPDPSQRFTDPAEMGQSLVAYMQRNSVNDTPILPPTGNISEVEPVQESPRKDETLPGENDEPVLLPETLSDELGSMIAQADELISHELPDPPAAPQVPSVDTLEAQLLQNTQEEAETEFSPTAPETEAHPEDTTPPTAPRAADTDRDLSQKRRKSRLQILLIPLVIGLILATLGGGVFWYYQEYYLLMVDSLSVTGEASYMTIQVDTEADNSLLTVTCTDPEGNTKSSPVVDGEATFTDLLPDTLYKIQLSVEGFHRLDGSTSHSYVTPAETSIGSFTAVTGPEDGSVILNFTVDGPDSEEWTVVCTAEGEETMTQTFTGHSVTITGLTVGKSYTFRLDPSTELYLVGDNAISFTAASIVIAENLQMSVDAEGSLAITWTAPEGSQVESWDVRCYSIDGYEQKLTTSELSATFPGISSSSAYTVEVTAAGMTQPARASISADPIHISDISVSTDNPMTLGVSWTYTGTAPSGGWLLLYTIDGSERQQVVQCEENSGIIEVRVPAATYDITIQAADGRTVFGGCSSFRTPNAEIYENAPQAFYPKAMAQYFFVNMLKTPDKENWTHKDVSQANYTTTFRSGEPISVFLYYMQNFYIRHENISVMYVIRNADGKVLADYIGMENLDWRDDMWRGQNYHYCGLDVPSVPTEPGTYTMGVYFNGLAVTSVEFTVTE